MGTAASWFGQAARNRLIALVLAMVVIVPLVASPADSSMRGFASLVYEGFAILLLATLVWRSRWDLRRESVVSFWRTGPNLAVVLFSALAVLSCLLSRHKAYSEQETLRLGAGVLLYFVAATQFRRSEHLSKIVDTLLFVAIGASLLGFAQYGFTSERFAGGLFGDHQLFGSFLAVLLPIVAVIAIAEKSNQRQLIAQIAAVMVGGALLLSHARTAWLGALAGLAVLAALTLYTAIQKGQLAKRKHEFVLPAMLIVAAAGVFFFMTPQTDSIVSRASSLSQADSQLGWQYRRQMWSGATSMVKARPLTGFGIGLYPYYQQGYTRLGKPIGSLGGRPSLGEQAHSFYLQTAAELGLPGLALVLAILTGFLIAGFRRLSKMDEGVRRAPLIGSMAATAAFAVDALASPAWQFGQISRFFWLLLGVGVGCLRTPAKHANATQPTPEPRALPPLVVRPAAIALALAVAYLLPTVASSAGSFYITPKSASITPKNATIRGGQILMYTLTVTFSDGSTQDVSTSPGTTFTETGGAGFMTGTNNRYYQSRWRESDTPSITGSYTQSGVTVSDTTTLTVVP